MFENNRQILAILMRIWSDGIPVVRELLNNENREQRPCKISGLFRTLDEVAIRVSKILCFVGLYQ
jgi:hypothetical protein